MQDVSSLNAEQAAELTTQAKKTQSIVTKDAATIQSDVEFETICDKIVESANKGLNYVSWWIKYRSTYQKFISMGYEISGGTIWEDLPPKQQKNWGAYSDMVTIAWGKD